MTTNKILVIGDAHVTDKQNLRRFDWLAQHVGESPEYDYTVIIGDFLTLNALSAWDRDKRKLMEDRRFFNEIAAGNLALDKLEATTGSLGKKIFIEGNHEERLKRYMEYHPEWDDGPINIPDLLNLKQRGWQYVNYRDYIHVGGIAFTHIPHGKIREIGGKDICSKAEATTVTSVVFGHTHELHTSCVHKQGQQHLQQILNVGCFFEQDEEYVKGRMTNYWKGVVELDNYSFGRFDISTVSMGRLKREYERGKKNV